MSYSDYAVLRHGPLSDDIVERVRAATQTKHDLLLFHVRGNGYDSFGVDSEALQHIVTEMQSELCFPRDSAITVPITPPRPVTKTAVTRFGHKMKCDFPFPFDDFAATTAFVFALSSVFSPNEPIATYRYLRNFLRDGPLEDPPSPGIEKAGRELLSYLGQQVPSTLVAPVRGPDESTVRGDTRSGKCVDTHEPPSSPYLKCFLNLTRRAHFHDATNAIRFAIRRQKTIPSVNPHGALVDAHVGRPERPVAVRVRTDLGGGGFRIQASPFDVNHALRKACISLGHRCDEYDLSRDGDEVHVRIPDDLLRDMRLIYAPDCATIGPVGVFVARGYLSENKQVRLLSHRRLITWLTTDGRWTEPFCDPAPLVRLLDAFGSAEAIWEACRDGRMLHILRSATARFARLSEGCARRIARVTGNPSFFALADPSAPRECVQEMLENFGDAAYRSELVIDVLLGLEADIDNTTCPRAAWSRAAEELSIALPPSIPGEGTLLFSRPGAGLYWTALFADHLRRYRYRCEREVAPPPAALLQSGHKAFEIFSEEVPNFLVAEPQITFQNFMHLWPSAADPDIVREDFMPLLDHPHPLFWEIALFEPIDVIEAPYRSMYEYTLDNSFSPPVKACEVDVRFLDEESLRDKLEETKREDSPVLFRTVSREDLITKLKETTFDFR